jgi:hypothetical protein
MESRQAFLEVTGLDRMLQQSYPDEKTRCSSKGREVLRALLSSADKLIAATDKILAHGRQFGCPYTDANIENRQDRAKYQAVLDACDRRPATDKSTEQAASSSSPDAALVSLTGGP